MNYCPNCKGALAKSTLTKIKLAEGCWECSECKRRFFIVYTSGR